MFLIDDNTTNDAIFKKDPDTGRWFSRGLVERNPVLYPQGCYQSAKAFDLPLIPRSEYSDRIKERERTKSTLQNIRRTSGPNGGIMPSLDQDGVGYCWNHSVAMGVMMLRAIQGQPYVRLSAFMVGCLIKNYRDEGGWGALGLDFVTEHGIPSVDFWKEKSMSRSNDTPEMRANAKLHRTTEGWIDLESPVYNRNLTDDQVCTLLLLGIPVVADFNWWGHSVLLFDLVEVERGSFGKRGINSWTDSWGDQGEFTLQGSKAILNGGVAPRVTVPSVS